MANAITHARAQAPPAHVRRGPREQGQELVVRACERGRRGGERDGDGNERVRHSGSERGRLAARALKQRAREREVPRRNRRRSRRERAQSPVPASGHR